MDLTRYRPITWVPVICFSFSMLTGCTTLRYEILDQTEPIKLEVPLNYTLSINVATKDGNGSHYYHGIAEELLPKVEIDLLNALKLGLVASGAASVVQPTKRCEPGLDERLVCITATVFNYERSFGTLMKEIGTGFLMVLGLGIPRLFIPYEVQDWVTAETILLDRTGKTVAQFKVQSGFIATYGIGSIFHPIDFWSKNNKELTNRIVRELAKHPHWFPSAPSPAS